MREFQLMYPPFVAVNKSDDLFDEVKYEQASVMLTERKLDVRIRPNEEFGVLEIATYTETKAGGKVHQDITIFVDSEQAEELAKMFGELANRIVKKEAANG